MKTLREKREKRHRRVRHKLIGSKERPRLTIHRSLKHYYVQLIDDVSRKTLLSYSTLHKTFREKTKQKKGKEISVELGKQFATEAKTKGFGLVVFDRGSAPFHGNIKAFAEACRENGLIF